MKDDSRENFKRNGLDTLRLSEKDVASLLSQIESQTPVYDGSDRRHNRRRRYKKVLRIIVRVAHPGGSDMTFAVRTRDLSGMGVGFFHGSFLYPGTPSTIILPALDGRMIAVSGAIVRCRLLSGKLHEVGVEFSEEIDITEFIDGAESEITPKAEPQEDEPSIFTKRKPQQPPAA